MATRKQQLARSHNWQMYCLGRIRNNLCTQINFLTQAQTVRPESIDIAFQAKEKLDELMCSLSIRKPVGDHP